MPSDLPWEQRIDLYCKGYENALEEGLRIGLDVFFGVEWSVNGADFLLYDIDKQWLGENEQLLMHSDERELFDAVRSSGGFIVHAHPFREAWYIPHISLYPHHVDAVETVNTRNSDPLFGGFTCYNDRAKQYAEMFGLPQTGGSDTHNAEQIVNGGILVPEKINTPADYLRQIKNGSVVPLEGDFSKQT